MELGQKQKWDTPSAIGLYLNKLDGPWLVKKLRDFLDTNTGKQNKILAACRERRGQVYLANYCNGILR